MVEEKSKDQSMKKLLTWQENKKKNRKMELNFFVIEYVEKEL